MKIIKRKVKLVLKDADTYEEIYRNDSIVMYGTFVKSINHFRQIIIDNKDKDILSFIKFETIKEDGKDVQKLTKIFVDAAQGIKDDKISLRYVETSFRPFPVSRIYPKESNVRLALYDNTKSVSIDRVEQVSLGKQVDAEIKEAIKNNPKMAAKFRRADFKNPQLKTVKKAADDYLDKEFEGINNEIHNSMAKYLEVTEETDRMFMGLSKDGRKDVIDYLTKHKLYDLKEHYQFISPDASLNKTNIQKQAASGKYQGAKTQYDGVSENVREAVKNFWDKKEEGAALAYQVIKYPNRHNDPILAIFYEDDSSSDYFHVPASHSNLSYLDANLAEDLGVIRYDKLLMENLKDGGGWELVTDVSMLSDDTGGIISITYKDHEGYTRAAEMPSTEYLNKRMLENNFDESKVVEAKMSEKNKGYRATPITKILSILKANLKGVKKIDMKKVDDPIHEVYIKLESTEDDISESSYFINSESDPGSFNKLNKFINAKKTVRG